MEGCRHTRFLLPIHKKGDRKTKNVGFLPQTALAELKKSLGTHLEMQGSFFFRTPQRSDRSAISLCFASLTHYHSYTWPSSSRTYSQDVIPLWPLHIQDVCSMTTAWWICLRFTLACNSYQLQHVSLCNRKGWSWARWNPFNFSQIPFYFIIFFIFLDSVFF